MNAVELADRIVGGLQPLISELPDGFYGSFRFTQTGNNLTHPVTQELLARILWSIHGVKWVGVDLRLNLGQKVKFQPDLTALAALHPHLQPVAFVDYESPNSDSLLPKKDVDAYLAWRSKSGQEVPYVIVTTFPDQTAEDWELRYAGHGYYNEPFHGQEGAIRRNPYRFWYDYFLKEFSERDMRSIALVNIDGKAVRRVYPG